MAFFISVEVIRGFGDETTSTYSFYKVYLKKNSIELSHVHHVKNTNPCTWIFTKAVCFHLLINHSLWIGLEVWCLALTWKVSNNIQVKNDLFFFITDTPFLLFFSFTHMDFLHLVISGYCIKHLVLLAKDRKEKSFWEM